MKRARQVHQKLERRKAILAMALSTLEGTPFQDITMAQIAERAGLAKGTLYLYFATKEELFLEVLRDQFHGWFWDLETGLGILPRRGRLAAAARLLAGTTASRPPFRRLLGVLHGNLEHNLPEETARGFNHELLSRSRSLGVHLERALPFLHEGQGLRLLLQLYALAIGLQSMTEPVAMVRQLREHQDLAPFRLEFQEAFLLGVRTLMVGLKAENRIDPGGRPLTGRRLAG